MKDEKDKEDKVLRNIKASLWITTITSIVAIIIFIIAYFVIGSQWLLLLAGLTVMAIFVFRKAARKIEYQYLQSVRKFKETEDLATEEEDKLIDNKK